MKFGGTSVANGKKIRHVAKIISDNNSNDCKVVVVVSALEGITNQLIQAAEEATKKNCTIKLIGSIEEHLKVEPIQISKHDPLAVDGSLNAVTFVSESAGEQTIIGRGAGGMETASAVLRDLLDIKQTIANKIII